MESSDKLKTNLEWALYYFGMGYSIMPVNRKKKPYLISWKEFEGRLPTEKEIKGWWNMWPDAGIAIITGKLSGIVALDFDIKHNRSSKEFDIPSTAHAKSGSGGEHFFFKHPGGHLNNWSGTFLGQGVDFKADGGYIIVEPSVNENGKYEWRKSLEDGIADMPEWLKEDKLNKGEGAKKWLEGKDGVAEGSRNDTATSMAGKIFSSMDSRLWDEMGWEQFQIWNNKNPKPLSISELKSIWNSVKKYHIGKENNENDKGSQADKLVKICLENCDILLFRSELDEPFIQFPIKEHKEYYLCRSKKTKIWLGREYWKKYSKTPNNDAINTALNTIEGHASYEGEKHGLENRVNELNNIIFYFLGDEEWQAIRISSAGWTLEKNPPILFRIYNHQQPQVIPVLGGDIRNLFSYINIEREDHKLLLLVWLVCCFIPGFPHPIIYFHGPQGSAKSTVSKILKKIIDPSKIDGSDFPNDQKELIQQLAHHWFLVFDNITQISSPLSDILCRAVTGSGFSKRELYSDDSDIIYNFKRCISLNGINLPSLKPDLLERSILVELSRIPKDRRREEKDMMDKFTEELPLLLGSIFSILSKAINIRPKIKISDLPRMADFTLWGCAIAEVLGYTREDFLKAYTKNISLQSDEVINDSFEASFIVEFMDDKKEWIGSATELFGHLQTKYAGDFWRTDIPKTPAVLSRKLMELKTTFEEIGIFISKKDGQNRKIIIRKGKENVAPSAQSLFENK